MEIISIDLIAGTSMIFNVSPITLNDGDYYKLLFGNNQAFPAGWTGEEAVFIRDTATATPVAIPVGNWRAKVLESDNVRRGEAMCLVYTANSLHTLTTGPNGGPCFITQKGICK